MTDDDLFGLIVDDVRSEMVEKTSDVFNVRVRTLRICESEGSEQNLAVCWPNTDSEENFLIQKVLYKNLNGSALSLSNSQPIVRKYWTTILKCIIRGETS